MRRIRRIHLFNEHLRKIEKANQFKNLNKFELKSLVKVLRLKKAIQFEGDNTGKFIFANVLNIFDDYEPDNQNSYYRKYNMLRYFQYLDCESKDTYENLEIYPTDMSELLSFSDASTVLELFSSNK